MPLTLPNLDDRRWTDLVEDGIAQIPRYAPEWTDYNLHDPGITFIDLYAWLAEMTNYRLNRVPPRHRLKFLELLGYKLHGPLPGYTFLSFAPPAMTLPFTLPAGVEFEGTNPDGLAVPFRTLRPVTVSVANIVAIQVDSGDGTLVNHSQDYVDHFAIEPFGAIPQAGAAFYIGFDALTPGEPVALGLRFAGPGNDWHERRSILEESIAEAEWCAPVRTRLECPSAEMLIRSAVLPAHQSVTSSWEVHTTTGWTALTPVQAPQSAAQGQVSDDTRSLTLDGIVEINVPAAVLAIALGSVTRSLFYIRCRMAGGAYDAVPTLSDLAVNAAPAEQSTIATETLLIRSGVVPTGPAPAVGSQSTLLFTVNVQNEIQSLSFGSVNGVPATIWAYSAPSVSTAGQISFDLVLSGIGTGLPNQQVSLLQAPVDVRKLELYTISAGHAQRWTLQMDFDASTRTSYEFVIDPTAGTVSFGTGERGRVPEANAQILVRYHATTASAGDVAEQVVNRARTSVINTALLTTIPSPTRTLLNSITSNRLAVTGSADAETLDYGLGVAVQQLHAHERLLNLAQQNKSTTLDQIPAASVLALTAPTNGVNLIDLERLAMTVPGTRVSRAHAWSSLHPDFPCIQATGIVTVIVVPFLPAGKPVPTDGLINTVWRYLNRRRMICTVLKVAGPEYAEITITASIKVRTGASAGKVHDRIVAALDNFLDPLIGGPNSLGWPFGRSVFNSEVLALIENVRGVDYVASMSMEADSSGAQCGDIALCPTALVTSGAHQIEVS